MIPAIPLYIPPAIPRTVTPRQARLALFNAGLLDAVQAAVDVAGGATKITWEYAMEISINDPLIASLAQSLELSQEQVEGLFIQAKDL
ncbi:MAG: hypothetical protein Q7V17_15040 [Afipia sp.]|nr:hypothetical protein [Afipia sp.]